MDRSSRESQRTITVRSVCLDNASFVLVNTLVTDERTRKRREQDMLPNRANDIARYPFQCTDDASILALPIPRVICRKYRCCFSHCPLNHFQLIASALLPYHKSLDGPSWAFRAEIQEVIFRCSACLACRRIQTMGAKFTHHTLVRRPNAHPFSSIHSRGVDVVRLRYELAVLFPRLPTCCCSCRVKLMIKTGLSVKTCSTV